MILAFAGSAEKDQRTVKLIPFPSVLFAAAFLPGCATIIDGSTMVTTVETNPPGASCILDRQGEQIATVAPTPGVMKYGKTKQDATLTCTLPGFATVATPIPSTFTSLTFINFAAGGAIGFIVDASTGANWSYPKHVVVELPPGPSTAAAPVPAKAVTGSPTS